MAAIGSQSESIHEVIEDEQDSGRPKPIDVETLLTTVIPSALGLSGAIFLSFSLCICSFSQRVPLLARAKLCLC